MLTDSAYLNKNAFLNLEGQIVIIEIISLN